VTHQATGFGFVEIYDVDAGTVAYTTVATGSDAFTSLYFNNRLFLFGTIHTPGYVYDGSTFAVIGYTGSSFAPYGGNVYKNRAYLIQLDEPAYWYTGISQVTGAVTKVDLSTVVRRKCKLSGIASFTLSEQAGSQIFQSFIFDNGDVLFYSGSYPNADDWGLVGSATIGQPIGYNLVVSYQGDSLVLCDSGVVSLRDLFLSGSEDASSLTVNANIQKTWTTMIQRARATYNYPVGPLFVGVGSAQVIWDPKKSRIIIKLPFYTTTSGVPTGNYFFVFDALLQAWSFHQSFGTAPAGLNVAPLFCAVYKNKVLMAQISAAGTNVMIYEKEGGTVYADRATDDSGYVGYDFEMLSAPIPFPKTAVYEATQIEPILESDLYTQTNWNLVADFGRQTSGNQTTDAATTSVQKPAVNVGMQNITYVQVKMSGTTVTGKTVGLNLYSYNVWYDAGEQGSR
jgi:hypothetical protein